MTAFFCLAMISLPWCNHLARLERRIQYRQQLVAFEAWWFLTYWEFSIAFVRHIPSLEPLGGILHAYIHTHIPQPPKAPMTGDFPYCVRMRLSFARLRQKQLKASKFQVVNCFLSLEGVVPGDQGRRRPWFIWTRLEAGPSLILIIQINW